MANYYVDATLGDDGNPGTQIQPWRTVSKVNSTSFSAGDNIYFKRGETWRETLTVPSSGSDGNPITFGAYGSGDSPIITGLEVVDSSDWVGPDANGEYTYSTTTNCVVFAEDGEFIPEGVAGSLSAGEWDYDSDAGILYYKPSSGTPSDHVTERGERNQAIFLTGKSYIKLENLDARGNNNLSNSCLEVTGTGNNIEVNNCVVKIAYNVGVLFDSDISNSTIQNTEVAQCTNRGIWLKGSDLEALDCHVHHIGQGNLIDSHDREGISVGGSNNVVESCRVHDCGHPSAGNSQSGWGILLHGDAGGNTVRYNTVYNIDHIGIGIFQSNDKAYYNIIHHCGIKATADEGYFGGIRIKGDISGIEVYNNVVYKCSDNTSIGNEHYGAGILIFAAADETLTVTLKNNIVAFNEANYDLVVREMDVTAQINLTSDYNCFYRSGGAKFHYDGSEKTFFEYQSASGQDQHSITQNPSFVDADYYDFHLQPTSPCIDAGTDVGLTEDYGGNSVPWGTGVDIGAFELIRRITVLSLSCKSLDCRSGGWLDLSRKGNHGTPYGGARPYMIAPGVMGFEFDGADGSCVYLGSASSLDLDEFTLMMWVFPRNIVSEQSLFGGCSPDNYTKNYLFILNQELIYDQYPPAGNPLSSPYFGLEKNVWQCVSVVQAPSRVEIFIGGFLYKETDNPETYAGTAIDRWAIGARWISGWTKTLDGIIALPRLVSRRLSRDEICESMYRSPIYRMLRGLPHSMIYTKVPWKQIQGGIYAL